MLNEHEDEKPSTLNFLLGEEVKKLQKKGIREFLKSILDGLPIKNIFQCLQGEIRKEQTHKRRSNNIIHLTFDDPMENHFVVDEMSFFDVDEILPEFEREFGQIAAKLIATIVEKDFVVTNSELASAIDVHVKTIESNKRKFRDNREKFMEILCY